MKIFIFLLLFLNSCNLITGVKVLGGGYYFDTDQILYSENTNYDGVGLVVVPNSVIDTKSDNNFVIVKSKNNENIIQYWIIDKEKPKRELKFHESDSLLNSYYVYNNVFGPLNLEQFENFKNKFKLKLEFN
jgi:hypothetical protein